MINFPNGYIIETEKPQDAFLVYGELNNTGFVAKGFRFNVPNLSHSGWGQKNELFLHLQSYLARLDSGRRIQFRYKRDSNYRRILDKYDADTERFSDLPFAREFRNRISAQFRKEMENHELRREYLTLYLSRPAKEFIFGALDVNSEKAMTAFTEKVTS